MTFFERCESIAKQKNISLNELGRQVGVSGAAINGWKNGSFPKVDVALKVAKVLGVSVEYLVTGDVLSAEETEFINLYRQIPKLYREITRDMMVNFSKADDPGDNYVTYKASSFNGIEED